MAAYVKVANAADLQPGQAMSVNAGDRQVALFNVGGTCYAIDDGLEEAEGTKTLVLELVEDPTNFGLAKGDGDDAGK